MKQQKAYGNESISSLKGADRVRLRPAVIFGSDGLEGCEHAVFEILSNAIDEARVTCMRTIRSGIHFSQSSDTELYSHLSQATSFTN